MSPTVSWILVLALAAVVVVAVRLATGGLAGHGRTPRSHDGDSDASHTNIVVRSPTAAQEEPAQVASPPPVQARSRRRGAA